MPIYKDQNRGTWFCKFNYKDWQGKIKQKKKEGFKTQKEAKEFERDFLNKAKADCDIVFNNLVELYLEDCRSRLKPTTLNNKTYSINKNILPYFKEQPINKITPAMVRTWQNELINKEYSQTYLKTIHTQLSAVFNYAVKYYNLSSNPAAICGSMGKQNADSMQFWTKEEFKLFLEAIKDNLISKAAFSILFWTGIRSGELLGLRLNDFDFINKRLLIRRNYARLKESDLFLEPKTQKSRRSIAIPAFLCDIVKEYAAKLYEYEANQRLFMITKYYLKREMDSGCKKSGVKRIRIHDLRHSHASLLIELGFSPLLIAERLGHEKVETTLQIYAHLYPNKHSEVAEKLEELY